MATERQEFVLSARQEGFDRLLRDLQSLGTGYENVRRILTGGPSAFTGIDLDPNNRLSVANTKLRETSALMSAISKANSADIARIRAQARLNIPEGVKGHIADPLVRREVDNKSRERVNDAHIRLERALDRETAAVNRAADLASKRAQFGAVGATMVNDQGRIAYPAKDDLSSNLLQAAVTRAHQETLAAAREEASLRKQRNANLRRDLIEGMQAAGDRRRQAAADAEGARQRGIYEGFQPTYANPDLSSKVGREEDKFNKAERAVETALNSRAEVLRRVNAGELVSADERHRSEQAVRDANRAYAVQTERLALVQAQATGGMRGQFMAGFRGASDMPYAQQLGQAFKFSVFYGTAYKLLFALTTTLTATLQEGIAFQQAMTELKIASGASADAANEMAQSLGRDAVAAGQAPSVGVEIGARSLGLFGATQSAGASQAEMQRVMDLSNRTVTRMALGSDLALEEIQTQLAAVANAFGGGAAGQLRAADLDAYLGRQFGVQQGKILQAVAESANVGQAAGFSQEEIASIAGLMQSRTGQSSSAVAGWMAQIFSRGGEGSMVDVASKYGIDPSIELADQVRELARVYKTASNQEQSEILASFGRGKVQNAAQVLIGSFDEITRAASAARTESVGEADRVADMRLGDIGGQIQVTVATMKQFASELGRTGVLDVLGAIVVTFRELVEGVTAVLQIWNQLPGAIKATIAGLLVLTATARSKAVADVAGGVLAARGIPVAPIATGGAAGGLANLALAGRAALRVVGPFAFAVGGLIALGALKGSADRQRAAMEASTAALRNSGLTGTSTPDDYLASASELDVLARDQRSATGGFANFLSFGTADNDNQAMARALEKEADRRREVAEAIERRAEETAIAPAAVSGFDADSLSQSLDLITASGGTARERLDALIGSLDGTADAAVRAAAAIDPDEFAGRLSTQLKDGVDNIRLPTNLSNLLAGPLGDAANRQATDEVGTRPEYEIDVKRSAGRYAAGTTSVPDMVTLGEAYEATQTEIEDRLKLELAAKNVGSLADLDAKTARDIAESIVDDTDFDPRLTDEALADARSKIVDLFARDLRAEAKGWRKLLKGNKQLTATELKVVVDQINADYDEMFDSKPETDLGGRVRVRREKLSKLRGARDNTSEDDMPELLRSIANARSQLAAAEIARLDRLRQVQQQSARSGAEVSAIGRRSLRAQMSVAVRLGARDELAQIISQAGSGSVNVARDVIRDAIAVAKAALGVRAQIYSVQQAAEGALDGMATFIGPVDPAIEKKAVAAAERLAQLEDFLAAVGKMVHGPNGNKFDEGTDVAGPEKYFEKDKAGKTKEQRESEREAARQEMLDLQSNLYLLSIDMRDPLAMAVAAVRDARLRLQSDIASGQDRATIAASRVALRQAQIEQQETARQEMLELQNNLYLLSIDLTDPLAQATAGVKEARRQLQSDIAGGATPSVIAGDRVALKQAQQEREATAFQQRLDAVTTAEELGRISHRKYLSYLQNERRRLDAIKNRTFQQQEQLDQIDRLMKSAAESMEGMWNFGDIKLPTPYQVRRQVEQMRLDRSTQLDATSRQVASQSTIYIDGADTGKVRQIINETLSKSNATVTNRPRRR